MLLRGLPGPFCLVSCLLTLPCGSPGLFRCVLGESLHVLVFCLGALSAGCLAVWRLLRYCPVFHVVSSCGALPVPLSRLGTLSMVGSALAMLQRMCLRADPHLLGYLKILLVSPGPGSLNPDGFSATKEIILSFSFPFKTIKPCKFRLIGSFIFEGIG